VAAPADWWADRALEARLAAATAAGPPRPGRLAVAVRHLVTGATAGLTADEIMPPASVFKLGLLVEAFRQIEAGRLTQEERLLLRPEDWAPGAGVLQARIGQQVTVGEALRLLIGVSDNTAALALLRRLGVDAVNAGYRRHGLARTRIYLDHRPDTTTAAETATLLALLATGRLAGPAATQQMLDLLAQEQPQAWIRPGLPPETAVAHKSGQLPGVRNDAAVVYGPHGPYVLVVLADRLDRPGELGPHDRPPRPGDAGEEPHEQRPARPVGTVRPVHRRRMYPDEHVAIPDRRPVHVADPNDLRRAVPGVHRGLHGETLAFRSPAGIPCLHASNSGVRAAGGFAQRGSFANWGISVGGSITGWDEEFVDAALFQGGDAGEEVVDGGHQGQCIHHRGQD
jgi:beta-lactamase class A